MTTQHIILSLRALLIAVMAAIAPAMAAFETDFFPRSSVLDSGRWVKVSVEADGLYSISAAKLRSWGFSDPNKVRVYGTTGSRMPDILNRTNVMPDLMPVQSSVRSDGSVVFFGSGAGTNAVHTDGMVFYMPNIYSSKAYYFVTESDTPAREIPVDASANVDLPHATSFMQRIHHEKELSSPGEAGPLLVGEDFRYTTRRNFDFTLPAAAVPGGKVRARVSYVGRYTTGTPSVSVEIPQTDIQVYSSRLSIVGTSRYTHGSETVFTRVGNLTADNVTSLRVTLELNATTVANVSALNSITLAYERPLALPSSGYLAFDLTSPAAKLSATVAADVTLWDVTDPMAIIAVKPLSVDNGALTWTTGQSGRRFYAAFTPSASLPEPTFEQALENQNLHGADSPDMVIVAPKAFLAQAQRFADFHAETDGMEVQVVDIEKVYNEFSAGRAEPAGLRNYLKMLYDRGAVGEGRPLRYLMIMGRMIFDNRHILNAWGNYPTIPGWTPDAVRASLSDNEGYFTDDYYAMLADNACTDMRYDKLSIAVGRVPVTDVTEARSVADKLLEYSLRSRKNSWKQHLLLLADDGDRGIHLRQTEDMAAAFDGRPGVPFVTKKVYLDAFTRVGGIYAEARDQMFRSLDEGLVWWNFIGHANTVGWTGDGILSYSDINQLYLRNLPFIYAATCDFLRLDGSSISGAEIMYKERYGGCIGVISATRPVYISENGPLSTAMGRSLALRDDDGRMLSTGEMYRRAKNDLRNSNGTSMADDNRFRYVFVGDPAMRLAVPENNVVIDTINGVALGNDDDMPVMAAMSRSVITGHIASTDGTLLSDFNGIVSIDIFDAEFTSTTTPEDDSDPINFEELGSRVFTGSVKVADGRFTMEVPMPAEISQNYRPAAIGAYAYHETENIEAVGFCREVYLYGYDEKAPVDEVPPVIESLVLNHSTFRNGDTVNPSPMLIATITDDVGINISTAGIGHQMSITLDGIRTFNDVASYYTPNTDGTPGGVINYPFSNLMDGPHELQLRIWDTSGNSERATLDFTVAQGLAPKIYDIYSDANPASTQANFYLSHDRPDAMIDVTVSVYDLWGRMVWSGTASGRSDMFLSVPVSWDLTDGAGRRVNRGIYLYRATITDDGKTFETASRKIAVTAR